MTDQTQAVRVAHRLAGLGAERGAFQVLINAAAQRQAAERGDRTQWSPWGAIPVRRQAQPHFNAANDHATPSQTTA